MEKETNNKLAQHAWNFINDSQRTNVCIRFAPEVICCAAIWMAARVLQIKLPHEWWLLFDATKEEIDAVFATLDGDASGSIEYKELNKKLRQGAGSA